MAAQHPEIKAELEQIEVALEGLSLALAPDVNPDVLDRVMEDINKTTPKPTTDPAPSTPAGKTSGGLIASVVPWLLAAAGILGLFYFYNQNGQSETELAELETRYAKLQKDCDESQQTLQSTQQFINELTNPATQDIILAGSDNAPNSSAIVFYNPATEKTLFRATNLPPPPSGKQYQLWAIDAEGPKDLGVLATNLAGDAILEVNHLSDVAAFAITLEDEGGKPEPDLTQLQVIGNVS